MARYIELDQKKLARLKREAQLFQDDIVCAVGTDFMQNIADAENKMIFDILKGLEDEPTADVVPRSEVENWYQLYHSIKEELKQEKIYHRETEKLCDRYCIESQQAKKQVAREIFEEIEKCMAHDYISSIGVYNGALELRVAELKKKYTEERQ